MVLKNMLRWLRILFLLLTLLHLGSIVFPNYVIKIVLHCDVPYRATCMETFDQCFKKRIVFTKA